MSGSEFLGRWSRRKRADGAPEALDAPDALDTAAAVDAADAADAAGPAPAHADAQSAVSQPLSVEAVETIDDSVPEPTSALVPEPPPLTDADMVPLESLDGGSDLSAFFSEGVSGSLRRAALRRVFHAPKFNVRDGLNDYDGDFTRFEPLGDIVTSDMKFRAAREEAARLRELDEASEETPPPERTAEEDEAVPEPDSTEPAEPSPAASVQASTDEPGEADGERPDASDPDESSRRAVVPPA